VTLDLRIDYVRAATPGKTIIAAPNATSCAAAWPSCGHRARWRTDRSGGARRIFMLVEASGWMKA
jgi:hypothetical protein